VLRKIRRILQESRRRTRSLSKVAGLQVEGARILVNAPIHLGKIANAALSHPSEQAKQRHEQLTQLAEILADIYAQNLVDNAINLDEIMPSFKQAA
jgi:hypothetical protein